MLDAECNERITYEKKLMKINIAALMSVREMLGWSHKTVEFAGSNLVDLFQKVTAENGKTLYDLFTQEDGIIGSEYMILLNRRRVMPEHSLEIPLQSGDTVIAMPAIRFARGG